MNKNGNILVSIIVPVYNTEQYLKKCIESLINQTYKNIEILLVDDGSTDSSSSICDLYAKKDIRIKVYHKKNEGVSIARNFALDRANGSWITFCDSDDWLHKDTIRECSTFFNESDFIRFYGIHVYKNKEIYKTIPNIKDKEHYLRLLLSRKTGLGVCGGIYSSKLFKKNRFNPKLYMGEDWQVLVMLAQKSEKISILSDYFYFYNRKSESSCCNSSNYSKWINCFEAYKEIKKNLLYSLPKKGYEVEFNTTKVVICFEAFKSISLSKSFFSDYLKCYDELALKGIIPNYAEIIHSKNTILIKVLMLLWSGELIFPLLCSIFKFYRSGNNEKVFNNCSTS